MINISWLCFELIYKRQTPIHIGNNSKLGICNETKYYIPGKTMWGAITALLTRWCMSSYDPNLYKKIGNFVKENLIFSYFYPYYEDKNGKKNILYPNYCDSGIGYGVGQDNSFLMSKEEFESKFITSYISTSINPNSKAAVDESLHEIELLNPEKFIGYLFINKNQTQNQNSSINISCSETTNGKDKVNYSIKVSYKTKKSELFEVIKNIQVGGDRTYGFGNLTLEANPKIVEKIYNKDDITLNLNAKKPTIEAEINLSHLRIIDDKTDVFNKFNKIIGEFEPMVWREWGDEGGMGHKISFRTIALKPGSRFEKKKIIIEDYGIWCLN